MATGTIIPSQPDPLCPCAFPCRGAPVAVKSMQKSRSNQTRRQTVNAISRETETLKRLQSVRNVVQLLDYFEDGDECHIVRGAPWGIRERHPRGIRVVSEVLSA